MNDALRTALLHQVSLSQAYELARAGDLESAGRLLDELADVRDSPDALDLRARIHAQRGELDDADRCWARVLELLPEDPDAASGRRTIEQIRRGGRRRRPVVHTGWLAVGGFGLLLTSLLLGVAWLVPAGIDRVNGWTEEWQQRVRAEARHARQEERRAESAERRLAEHAETRASAAASRERAVAEIARELRLPGVRVRARERDVRIVFEQGLFLYDTVPSESGPDLLRRLGSRLGDLPARTTVVGHSVPVPGEANTGGSELAQRRAQVAAGFLAEGSGLGLTAFAMTVAEQGDGPFEDAERNRTVTLLVEPDESMRSASSEPMAGRR